MMQGVYVLQCNYNPFFITKQLFELNPVKCYAVINIILKKS